MIKPTGKYILLSVKKHESTSTIITVEKYRKKERKGVILALGNYVREDLRVGMEVYFETGSIKVTEWGEMMNERNITLI